MARERPDRQIQVEPGDNRKYLSHNMAIFNWTKPNMKDEKQVIARITDYFDLCEVNDMKPSVAGLALAFDVDRNTIYRWANDGEGSKQLSDESRRSLKKAYKILNAQMEDYMQNGKIIDRRAISAFQFLRHSHLTGNERNIALFVAENSFRGDANDT